MSTMSKSFTNYINTNLISKNLLSHLCKAINSQEIPPKHKHVRAILLETYKQKSSVFYYTAFQQLNVISNPITSWKYLIVLHKIMRSGFEEAKLYDFQKITVVQRIYKTHADQHYDFSPIISKLCNVIIQKFSLHQHFTSIPANLEISLNDLIERNKLGIKDQFVLVNSLMTYLETLLIFQKAVYSPFKRDFMFISDAIQCRLVALIQCIQDSAALYDLIVKLMIKLHCTMDLDVLDSYRLRFDSIFCNIQKFFNFASGCSYFKKFLKIPLLPDVCPNFLDFAGSRNIKSVVVSEPSVASSNNLANDVTTFDLIDISQESDLFEEASVSDEQIYTPPVSKENSVLLKEACQPALQHNIQENYKLELDLLKSEMHKLQNENLERQELLVNRIRTLEEEIKATVQMRSNYDDQIRNLSSSVQKKTTALTNAEDRFKKMRNIYTKLSEEHVETLVKLNNLQVQCNQLQSGQSSNTDSMVTDLQKMVSDLHLLRDSDVKSRQIAETQLEEVKGVLKSTEDRVDNLLNQVTNAKNTAAQDLKSGMLKVACDRASEDLRSVVHVTEDVSFLQCRSCVEIVIKFISLALLELVNFEKVPEENEDAAKDVIILNVSHLAAYLCTTVLHVKAVANAASYIEKSDELSFLCTSCVDNGISLFSNLVCTVKQTSTSTSQLHASHLKATLLQIQLFIDELKPQIKDVDSNDLATMLENEMKQTMNAIKEAEARFKELQEKSRSSLTGVDLKVNKQILDSCTDLMQSIAQLVAKSRILQNEIVNEGRGTAPAETFFKLHNRWTDGLFSAAKSVGVGATFLMESADSIISDKGGKLEQLIVAALDISACTTQLLVASRVKARSDSQSLVEVLAAAKAISQITGKIVADATNAVTIREQSENMDFQSLSFTKSRKAEVDLQVHIIELESSLNAERCRLAELRRHNYSNSAEVEQKSTVG